MCVVVVVGLNRREEKSWGDRAGCDDECEERTMF